MSRRIFYAFMVLLLTGFFPLGCKADSSLNPEDKPEEKSAVNIKYLGHSCFLITTPDSLQIVTDPYGRTMSFLSWPDTVTADIVTVSHMHDDHDQVKSVKGNPVVLKDGKVDTIGSVKISAFETQHGDWGTQKMGDNWIYIFRIGDIRLVHLGETASFSKPEIYEAIRDADVVFIPIGQTASVSFAEIKKIINSTSAHIIIPHHFSPDAKDRFYGSSTVDEFNEFIQPYIKVTHADFIHVTSKMPQQVVVLKALFAK